MRERLVTQYLRERIGVPGMNYATAPRGVILAWCRKRGYPEIYVAGVTGRDPVAAREMHFASVVELESWLGEAEE